MCHVMVVDDDQLSNSMICSALERAGHTVVAATSGREALNGLCDVARPLPQVIVTDIFMPDMDGLELIRSVRVGNAEIKIIAISAGSSKMAMDFLPVASKFGADRILSKPLRIPALLEAVSDLVPAEA